MTETLYLDFAQRIPPASIKTAGYTGVLRYLAPPESKYDWKRLTATERDETWAAGLCIGVVWESYASRATEGFQAGVDDARAATGVAQTLGVPEDVPIFFACDTDTTADIARPYFRGVATVRPCCGAYGGIRVVDPLLTDGTARYGWQTCAWSGGKVSQLAHLYQRLKPTKPLQGSFDEDVVLKPLPMWTPPVLTPAVLRKDDMPIYQVTDGPLKDSQWYDYGQGLVHLNGTMSQELIAGGTRVQRVSGATYTAGLAPRQPVIAQPPAATQVDVGALATQLSATLGPEIGKQLVAALGAALTGETS